SPRLAIVESPCFAAPGNGVDLASELDSNRGLDPAGDVCLEGRGPRRVPLASRLAGVQRGRAGAGARRAPFPLVSERSRSRSTPRNEPRRGVPRADARLAGNHDDHRSLLQWFGSALPPAHRRARCGALALPARLHRLALDLLVAGDRPGGGRVWGLDG